MISEFGLNPNDLLNLKGPPLPQDASFDQLRLKDVPGGTEVKAGQRRDPLVHYAGRVNVAFTGTPGKTTLTDLKPLSRSRRMLLQAMSEEQATGFATEDAGNDVKRITKIGRDPWRVQAPQGTVKFQSGSAPQIPPLDFNGYPAGAVSRSAELKLASRAIYCLVTRTP